ncbi:ScbR family autoregulator-binding transcription factor [Streptomyces sp. NPDC050504]|uniref:ScbR family autoregulator-binding transcription factor n=1 Tax=Streptomyces sp. NPDC050504 TaxID=3365618 RepID=UPI0037950B34
MVKQQRARRTRQALILAAARAFDTEGYDRASLTRIAVSAEVTKGGLFFHFPSKESLAETVHQRAHLLTGEAVRAVAQPSTHPVQELIDVSHAVVALLEHDPVVRAGARLWREGAPETGRLPEDTWYSAWLERTTALLKEAERDGALHERADAATVLDVVAHVLVGLEMSLPRDEVPRPGQPPFASGPLRPRLARIWDVLLPVLAPPGEAGGLCPEGRAHHYHPGQDAPFAAAQAS